MIGALRVKSKHAWLYSNIDFRVKLILNISGTEKTGRNIKASDKRYFCTFQWKQILALHFSYKMLHLIILMSLCIEYFSSKNKKAEFVEEDNLMIILW